MKQILLISFLTLFILSTARTALALPESTEAVTDQMSPSVSIALSETTYFDQIDATIKLAKNASLQRLVAERFVRMSARISVYSLYCDLENKRGYNVAYSKFRNRMTQLNQLSENAFGGQVALYNAFEDARNEESLTFVKATDPDQICASSLARYKALVQSAPAVFQKSLSTPAFGSF